ncbi:hypothetical protein [Ectobacillus funiculus]|uniref:hypothetical protein n=1 Tax=Ectobacillus funiculus TaxID=137993 RepID=UPI00397929FB
MIMIRDFISTIPRELDEAAKMDGCGPLKTFFYIKSSRLNCDRRVYVYPRLE